LETNPTFAYVRFPDGKESSVRSRIYLHVRCLMHPLVHPSNGPLFADNVPEPGREHDVAAPPVVNEPDGGSSDVDHQSAGTILRLRGSLHASGKLLKDLESGSRSTCSGVNVSFRHDYLCVLSL